MGMLSYTIIKPEGNLSSPCNDSLGLLGNSNGDDKDDFVNLDGTSLSGVLNTTQIYSWCKQCEYNLFVILNLVYLIKALYIKVIRGALIIRG